MTHQILLVGNEEFSALISQQVRGLETLAVKVSRSVGQAEQQMLQAVPDVVIGQAALFNHCSITQQYRQHQQLTGIYVVLVEDAPNWPTDEILPPLQRTASALEAGADAYVWLAQDETQLLTQRWLQSQIKQGLERAKTHRDLQRTNNWLSAIALMDSLTQLHNRRALDMELPQQIQVAHSQGYDLSLMMLDVDHFKQINDQYGHLAGDQILQQLAQRLSHNLRFYDTVFRYGGEEFVLILHKTDAETARLMGQRLCDLVASKPFPLEEELSLSVSVSIGGTCLETRDDLQGQTLLRRADQNLFLAKAQGRNRVVFD